MKLHTAAYLTTVLTLTTATREEVEIGPTGRFLADRDVMMSELETHATYEDGLWTALDGIVYDITDFTHPGGEKYILYVGGMEGDELYMEAYNEKYHPYTIAEMVTQPNINRIGPLVYDPPTSPISPVSPVLVSSAPVTADSPVASDAPVTADSPVATDAPVTTDDAVASDAPVTIDASVASGAPVTIDAAVASDAPTTVDAPADAPTTSSKPETGKTVAPSEISTVSAATKEPTEDEDSNTTVPKTSPSPAPVLAAPTSNGSSRDALFHGLTTIMLVVVSFACL